jgi:hypothetical protein
VQQPGKQIGTSTVQHVQGSVTCNTDFTGVQSQQQMDRPRHSYSMHGFQQHLAGAAGTGSAQVGSLARAADPHNIQPAIKPLNTSRFRIDMSVPPQIAAKTGNQPHHPFKRMSYLVVILKGANG